MGKEFGDIYAREVARLDALDLPTDVAARARVIANEPGAVSADEFMRAINGQTELAPRPQREPNPDVQSVIGEIPPSPATPDVPPVRAADEVAGGLPRHSDVVQEHSSSSDFISAVENPREVGPLAPGIHVAGPNVYRVDAAGNAVRDRSIKSGFNYDTHEFTFALRNVDPVPANISGKIEGTQVVDVAGKPLRVFHGTRGDFPVDQLRPDRGANFGGDANVVEGIFFSPERETAFGFGSILSPSRGPIRTIEAYVNFQNPATFRDAAARDFDVARLKADGFDGFVNIDRDGDIWEVVAFDNSTIYPVQTRIQTGSRAPEEIIPLTSQETPSVRPATPDVPPVRAADEGSQFSDMRTGEPVTFRFIRNTEPAPNFGTRFAQDVEPSGRYMSELTGPATRQPVGYETGSVTFKNPLYVNFGEGYESPGNWKRILANQYDATGEELSRKLTQDGFDGIVTVDQNGMPSEIVDLTRTPAPPPVRAADETVEVTPLSFDETAEAARRAAVDAEIDALPTDGGLQRKYPRAERDANGQLVFNDYPDPSFGAQQGRLLTDAGSPSGPIIPGRTPLVSGFPPDPPRPGTPLLEGMEYPTLDPNNPFSLPSNPLPELSKIDTFRNQAIRMGQAIKLPKLRLRNRVGAFVDQTVKRVDRIIRSQAALFSENYGRAIVDAFPDMDDAGRIPSLAGIDSRVSGAPHWTDIGPRFPTYEPHLNEAQLLAYTNLRNALVPYRETLRQLRVTLDSRHDVQIGGGFYIPRTPDAEGMRAVLDINEPIILRDVTSPEAARGRESFEKAATFESAAAGIDEGNLKYLLPEEGLNAYIQDVGTRSTKAWIANLLVDTLDETGYPIADQLKKVLNALLQL